MTDKARALLAEYMEWYDDGDSDMRWLGGWRDRVRAYLAEPVRDQDTMEPWHSWPDQCAESPVLAVWNTVIQYRDGLINLGDVRAIAERTQRKVDALAEPVTAPAGLADALADRLEMDLPDRTAQDYAGQSKPNTRAMHFNEGRAVAIKRLRSIEAAPTTCTLAEALAMAEPGDVLKGSYEPNPGQRWMAMHIAGSEWVHDTGLRQRVPDPDINWHTFIHNGAVYSIREGEAGASGLPDTGKPTCNDVAEAGAEPLAVGESEYALALRTVGANVLGALDDGQPEQLHYSPGCTEAAQAIRTLLRKLPAAEQPADAPSVAELAFPPTEGRVCDACGAPVGLDPAWRCAGDHWQHKCPGVPAQAGHIGRDVPQIEYLAEQLRTLQQDVAALKQQGGELREGEPCLAWCPGATIPAWACTRYDPARDVRNGGEFHYLPQPAAPGVQ